ncbi:hypothetical protein Dimus_021901 [Dionaea muscipula]
MVKGVELLTEDERRALRGSKFAPLPSLPPPSARDQPRLAHPGGPVTTNKAVALAKFLERKLMEPGGLDSMNPDLIEMAVKNAKETVTASETSDSGRMIRHVASFGDCQVPMVSYFLVSFFFDYLLGWYTTHFLIQLLAAEIDRTWS